MNYLKPAIIIVTLCIVLLTGVLIYATLSFTGNQNRLNKTQVEYWNKQIELTGRPVEIINKYEH